MPQLNLVAILNKLLLRPFQFLATRITPYVPEICNPKDDIGTVKGSFKGLDIVKVSLNYLDPFGCPSFGCLGGGIASYAAEGVAWVFDEGVSHGAALEEVSKEQGRDR
jgi:hypothetical protein